MTAEIKITDEMIRVINGDYLVRGISAREAVRRILALAEEQRTKPEPLDFSELKAKGFPKLDTTETGVITQRMSSPMTLADVQHKQHGYANVGRQLTQSMSRATRDVPKEIPVIKDWSLVRDINEREQSPHLRISSREKDTKK